MRQQGLLRQLRPALQMWWYKPPEIDSQTDKAKENKDEESNVDDDVTALVIAKAAERTL